MPLRSLLRLAPFVLMTFALVPPRAAAETSAPDLIPRKILFGNPVKAGAEVSPDGKWIAWRAPRDGVMNIFVAPVDHPEAGEFVTAEKRAITQFIWTYSSRHILYLQDEGGNENYHVFAADLDSRAVRDLTPFPGVRAGLQHASRKIRDEVMIALNKRDPRYFDLYRLNYRTGALTLVAENPGYLGFFVDDEFVARFAFKPLPDGGVDYLIARNPGKFEPWQTVSRDDAMTTGILDADFAERKVFMRSSKDRDTAALYRADLATGARTLLAEDEKADVGGVIFDRATHEPLAYFTNYDRPRAHVLSEKVRGDIAFLAHEFGDDWRLASRSEDDHLAVISVSSDVKPLSFYLYDRAAKTLTKLFDARPELADAPLGAMRPRVIRSRDGLDLVSYLTLPKGSDAVEPGVPEKPLPLVLEVHGGPWGRTSFGFSGYAQWLANRGYATLAVNFRSSTGFGKAFANAGDREWGRKMDDDLLDAVAWAIDNKIADPAHIAIMGGSYGGYATLASMTRNPDIYACGVDLFGPSDLDQLLRTVPPYWAANRAKLINALGDPATPEGQALLKERSPLFQADRIKKPLMIVQGARDPRVVKAHSDEIVAALQSRGVPVTYVVVGNEGHGFTQPENNIAINALAESFLKSCLGGRAEPIHAEEMTGTTLEVPVGAERIDGFKGRARESDPAN